MMATSVKNDIPNMLDHVCGLVDTEAPWVGTAEWMAGGRYQSLWAPGSSRFHDVLEGM